MSKVDGGKIAARPPNDILVVSYKLRIQIGIAFYELVYVLEELISLFVDALAIVMQALVCGNGPIEGALAGGEIALEALKQLNLIGSAAKKIGLQFIEVLFGLIVLVQRTAVEPFGNGYLLGESEEQGFVIIRIVEPFILDFLQFGWVLVGENQFFRTEAVLESIPAGTLLAAGTAGPGAAGELFFFACAMRIASLAVKTSFGGECDGGRAAEAGGRGERS